MWAHLYADYFQYIPYSAIKVFSVPYDFLNNIFSSLAYVIVRIQHIIYKTYKIRVKSIEFAVRLLVKGRLLVVQFGGELKIIHGFLTV